MSHKVSEKDLKEFDAWAFCRLGGKISDLDCQPEFSRLKQDLQFGRSSVRSWTLSGGINAHGECVVQIGGALHAVSECVVCGETVSSDLSFDRKLVLKKSEQHADESENEETDEDIDFVACPGPVNMLDWLEDELFLICPMFPKHAQCEYSANLTTENNELALDSSEDQSEKKTQHPFADLSSLLEKVKK